ncbi:MAG: hypothetical protein CL917_19010 [Deltaproteobacteria bacterium]|nr:hypothetical protein [Deltaproteobacteria bacterium]
MSTPGISRVNVMATAGLILLALLLWSYCGPMNQTSDSVVVAEPPEEGSLPPVMPDPPLDPLPVKESVPVPVAVTAPVEAAAEESVSAAILAVESDSAPIPVVVAPVPVVVPPPVVEEVALPSVSAPAPAFEPVPEQDLLIAKRASERFVPDVAALADANLAMGVPIQGDESSLNVLQPCDTPASACAGGFDPAPATGGPGNWTGVVLPGF